MKLYCGEGVQHIYFDFTIDYASSKLLHPS